MNSVGKWLNEIIPVYAEVFLTVYTSSLGWTHFCQKDRWDFIPGWKKERNMCNHFIPGWNFTINIFLLNFWRIYQGSSNLLELRFASSARLNIMKVTRNVLQSLFSLQILQKNVISLCYYHFCNVSFIALNARK